MSTTHSKPYADVGETLADLLCLPHPDKPRESRRGYLSVRVVKGAAELVDASGVLEQWQRWRDEDIPDRDKRGGAPTKGSTRIAFIVLIALVAAGEPPLVSRISEVLTSRLQTASRDLLGLPRFETASDNAVYHRVYRALRRLLEPIDPYPGEQRKRLTRREQEALRASWDPKEVDRKQQRLVWFTNSLLEASVQLLPETIRAAWEGNLCLDATLVKVWGKAGSPKPRVGRDPSEDRMSPEHLAGWYTREGDHREPDTPAKTKKGRKKVEWGYEAHLAVMTANDPTGEADPEFPLLILAMTLDKPAGRVAENALTLTTSIVERGWPTGVCAADRAYLPNSKPEKLQLPVRAQGYLLCFDYRDDQLGIQAEYGGALLIEGTWYCPAIPKNLIDATEHYRKKLISEEVYLERIKQRSRYRFRPKHQPTPDGNTAHMCPARGPGATAACSLVPLKQPVALGLPTTRTRILLPPTDPDVCCTNTTSLTIPSAPTTGGLPTAAAKYHQDFHYGSPRWHRFYATLRNTIEGVNGFTKSATEEDLEEPGRRRVRGYAYQALLVAALITASNLRKINTFLRKREAEANSPKPTPTAHTKPHADLSEYRPTLNGPPLAQPAA